MTDLPESVVGNVDEVEDRVVARLRELAENEPERGAVLLVRLKRRVPGTPLSERPVRHRRGQDPTHLFHNEEPRLCLHDHSQELPEEGPPGIVQGASLANRAEALTARASRHDHGFARLQPGKAEDVGGRELLDLLAYDLNVGADRARVSVLPDRCGRPLVGLDRDADVEAGLVEPQVEPKTTGEE